MQRIHAVGLLAAAALLCSSCTPVVVETPTPTPVATLQCQGEFTEETHPCDQAEYDAVAARDAQYEEAERTFRRVVALLYELRSQRRPMNDELSGLVSGSYGQGVEETLHDGLTSDIDFSGQPVVVWVTRENTSDGGSTLALQACTAPGTATLESNGFKMTPKTYREQLYFTQIDGRLRLSSNRVAEVTSCDG